MYCGSPGEYSPVLAGAQDMPVSTKRSPEVVFRVVQRRRRWTNIKFGHVLCLQGMAIPLLGKNYTPSKHRAFIQCYFNVGSASKTVGRHWNSIGCLLPYLFSQLKPHTINRHSYNTLYIKTNWNIADHILWYPCAYLCLRRLRHLISQYNM